MAEVQLADLLREMEERLLLPETRGDASALRMLLTPEFVEFGSSGRVFDRGSIVALLVAERTESPVEKHPAQLHLEDFACIPLSENAALVTYRSCARLRFMYCRHRLEVRFGCVNAGAGKCASIRAHASICPKG